MDKKINVYLDDCRDTPEGFQIRVHTYEETIQVLKKMEGFIGTLSLDNDLGEEKEGKDVMDWIEKQFYTKKYKLPTKIVVHSMNPIAKQRMLTTIDKLYGEKNG